MATKLFLKSPLSSLNSIYGYASLVRSVLAAATAVTNTTASGTKIQATKTGGGTVVKWISPPLLNPITISGTVTFNLWAKEANAANNATVRMELQRYTAGAETGVAFAAASFGSEVTTTILAKNWTATPSSTTFLAGDRIVAYIYIVNVGTMGAGSPGVTVDYAGPTNALDGDSFFQFTENINFQSEAEIIQIANPAAVTNATLAAAAAAGNAIFATLSWNDQVSTVTLADGTNTYTSIAAFTNFGTGRHQSFLAKNIAGLTPTVTPTFSGGTPSSWQLQIVEIAGLDKLAPVDTSVVATGSGTALASGSLTTTYQNELLITGAATDSSPASTISVGAGYVKRNTDAAGSDLVEDKAVIVAGSNSASGTASQSGNWVIELVALKWATQPPNIQPNEDEFQLRWVGVSKFYDTVQVEESGLVPPPIPPIRVTQVAQESIFTGTPSNRITQVPIEIISTGTPSARVSQVAVEFIIRAAATVYVAPEDDGHLQRWYGWRALQETAQEWNSSAKAIRPPSTIPDDAESASWKGTSVRVNDDTETHSGLLPVVPSAIPDDADISKWTGTQALQYEDTETHSPAAPDPPQVIPDESEMAQWSDRRSLQDDDMETQQALPPDPPTVIPDDADNAKWGAISAMQHDDMETQQAIPPVPPMADDPEIERWIATQSIQLDDTDVSLIGPIPISPDMDLLIWSSASVVLSSEVDTHRVVPPPPALPPTMDDPEISAWRAQGMALSEPDNGFVGQPPIPPLPPIIDDPEILRWISHRPVLFREEDMKWLETVLRRYLFRKIRKLPVIQRYGMLRNIETVLLFYTRHLVLQEASPELNPDMIPPSVLIFQKFGITNVDNVLSYGLKEITVEQLGVNRGPKRL